MISLSKLSNNDRYHIAEFLYSNQNDILIRSDAENVIELFKKHKVPEAFTTDVDAGEVMILIANNVAEADYQAIMQDYYTGKLNYEPEKTGIFTRLGRFWKSMNF